MAGGNMLYAISKGTGEARAFSNYILYDLYILQKQYTSEP
jgi:hypothetical protein